MVGNTVPGSCSAFEAKTMVILFNHSPQSHLHLAHTLSHMAVADGSQPGRDLRFSHEPCRDRQSHSRDIHAGRLCPETNEMSNILVYYCTLLQRNCMWMVIPGWFRELSDGSDLSLWWQGMSPTIPERCFAIDDVFCTPPLHFGPIKTSYWGIALFGLLGIAEFTRADAVPAAEIASLLNRQEQSAQTRM